MGLEDARQLFRPGAGFAAKDALFQGGEDEPVGPFAGSVGLGVVNRGEMQFCSELLTICAEAARVTPLPVVDGELAGDAEAVDKVLSEELDYVEGSDGHEGFCLHPLGEEFHRH